MMVGENKAEVASTFKSDCTAVLISANVSMIKD